MFSTIFSEFHGHLTHRNFREIGKREAVIQLVLGPGKECQRGQHYFYQDVGYMENVGSHLTQHEGLCHIGEWHSHHTVGLKRPSGGDERTVWSNMPSYGFKRFILLIANIESLRSEVSVGCFLFEFGSDVNRKQQPVLPGRFVLLPEVGSPLRLKCQPPESGCRVNETFKACRRQLQDGAESLNTAAEIKRLELIKPTEFHRPVVKICAANENHHTKTAAGNEEATEEGDKKCEDKEDEIEGTYRNNEADVKKRCSICSVA